MEKTLLISSCYFIFLLVTRSCVLVLWEFALQSLFTWIMWPKLVYNVFIFVSVMA